MEDLLETKDGSNMPSEIIDSNSSITSFETLSPNNTSDFINLNSQITPCVSLESSCLADHDLTSETECESDVLKHFPIEREAFLGLPEKYFLPSPTVQSGIKRDRKIKSDDSTAGGMLSSSECNTPSNLFSSYDSFQMTRGEPTGEESGIDAFVVQPFPTDDEEDGEDLDMLQNDESFENNRKRCDYIPVESERPPLVGQSNDPRGQVASGMSGNSSSDVSSSYNSALSGSWKEEDDGEDVEGVDEPVSDILSVKDSISVKVSLLLDEDERTCEGTLSGDSRDPYSDITSELIDSTIEDVDDIDHRNTEPNSDQPEPSMKLNEGTQTTVSNCKSISGLEIMCEPTANLNLERINSRMNRISKYGHRREKKVDCDVSSSSIEIDNERDVSFVDNRPASPTSVSSIASSKRLEWDSGADIGYKTVSSSAMSQTEADVLQWANHHLPLTRTEPEGKSFHKEKGKVLRPFKQLKQKNDEASKLAGISENAEEVSDDKAVDQLQLNTSMNSISSEIFKEVLYGSLNDTGIKDSPLKTTENDVIVRVRRLLSQSGQSLDVSQNSSKSNSPSKASGIDVIENTDTYAGKIVAENSPSHSSSSWSAKSSHTVVMTPIGQPLDDVEETKTNSYSSDEIKHKSNNSETRIFARRRVPPTCHSVSIQTEPKTETNVPRPVFPRGKSKSLDILPTVLKDVAVNTDLPYCPSSDEMNSIPLDDPDEHFINEDKVILERAIFSGADTPVSSVCPKNLPDSNYEPSESPSSYSPLTNCVNRREKGTGELLSPYQHDHQDHQDPKLGCGSSSGKKLETAGLQNDGKLSEAESRSTQSVAPYWPPGVDCMYYTLQDMAPGYHADVSKNSQKNQEAKISISSSADKESSNASPNSISSGHFYTSNNSREGSSTDFSLPTKRFTDRSQWLQEMARVEKNQRTLRQRKRNGNNSWQQLNPDLSQSSSYDRSSEVIVPQTHNDENPQQHLLNRSFGVRPAHKSRTSMQIKLTLLKDIISEQRQSYLRKLLREIERIEKLEALMPQIMSRKSDTSTLSPSESELVRYLKKKDNKHRNTKYNRIDEAQPSASTADTIKRMLIDKPENIPATRNVGRVSVALQTTPSLFEIDGVDQNCFTYPKETYKEEVKKPVCWVIPLSKENNIDRHPRQQQSLSLQEALHQQVSIIKKLKDRRTKLAQVAQYRHQDEDLKARILASSLADIEINEKRKRLLQKNASKNKENKKKTVFTHKEMRDQTERIYKNLPEVMLQNVERKRKEDNKANRLMVQLYNRKLNEQTLRGKVSWLHTQKCLKH